MNWQFTPDQFVLAWESSGLDRYPFPLSVRPTSKTVDERAAVRESLRPWLERTLDGDFQAMVQVLTNPQTRIQAFGLDADARRVRVLGVSAGQTSVVASQRPGLADDGGADISITLGKRSSLAAEVVAALPRQKVGSEPARSAPLTEVQRDSKDTVMSAPNSKSVAGQIRRTLRLPRCGVGHMLVTSRLDEADNRPERVLNWIDVVDDGRYVVRSRRDVEVIPGSDEAFATQLRRVVDEAGLRS